MDIIWEPEVWWTPAGQPTVSFPSRMFWKAENPLEITIIFGGTGTSTEEAEGDVARWVMGRDLIREARAKRTAGLGDVKVEVINSDLILELNSPHGTARLITLYLPVEKFLAKTYAEVSVSTEVDCLPLSDATLEKLMEIWEGKL